MNTDSRTKNTVRNIFVTIVCHITSLVLSFVVRTLFIRLLGTDYLGINGLYTNILSVLSLAELGLGTAIAYSLYKPVATEDHDRITALMKFYKSAYRIVALSVAVIGLSLVPFLHSIIKTETEVDHLILYYLLFLANSVSSYFFAYKATLLLVDQKNFIIRISNTSFNIAAHIIQLLVLFLTGSYIGYLIVQISCTFLGNVTISLIVDKQYKFLKNNKSKLTKEERKPIFQNIRAMFSYKIGGVILNNTDNILISAIINTTLLGLYSNYTLIVGAVQLLVEYISNAMVGSIGNLNAYNNKKKSEEVFDAVSLFTFWIHGFCAVALYTLINDFIYLWLGNESYILDRFILFAIVANYVAKGLGDSTVSYRTTTGIFRQLKYLFLFTSAINIILSIILGIKFGLFGILISTVIARLLTNLWYEPFILYRDYFGTSPKRHYLQRLLIVTLIVISCAIINFAFSFVPHVTYITFICKMASVIVVPNLVFLVAYCRTKEFRFIISKIKPFIKKLKK